MSNEYYKHLNAETEGATARASSVNTSFDEVMAGFDKLPTEEQLKYLTPQLGTDGGTANSYLVTPAQKPAALSDGLLSVFKVANANTGASTLNLEGSGGYLGALSIVRPDGNAVVTGDIPSGSFCSVRYSQTRNAWVLVGTYSGDAALAQAWASQESGTVDGVSKSAKQYAGDAAASAVQAAASASSASGSASSASASAGTASASLADFNDRYKVSATDPGAIGAGRAWFDTAANQFKVRNASNSGWEALTSNVLATRATYVYTATAAQTEFTGADDNAASLAYTVGDFTDVFQNGSKLAPSDYTMDDGSSLTLDTGASASDLIVIVTYAPLTVAQLLTRVWVNTNTTAEAGNHYLVDTSGGAVTLTLPASPMTGDAVRISDTGGAFGIHALTIGRNGETITGDAEDMIVSVCCVHLELIYNGSDWRLA